MDHWPTETSIPLSHSEEQRSIQGARPLKAVSGNRQTFALDRHAGPENQHHHDLYSCYDNPSLSQNKYTSNGFPTPAALGSSDNDRVAQRLQHRNHRRQRQGGSSIKAKYQDRSYLSSSRYQEYRTRPRKDLGQDNKQVWSDNVEEAFHEGTWIPGQVADLVTLSSSF